MRASSLPISFVCEVVQSFRSIVFARLNARHRLSRARRSSASVGASSSTRDSDDGGPEESEELPAGVEVVWRLFFFFRLMKASDAQRNS